MSNTRNTMITREQFEARVRAEAEKKYLYLDWVSKERQMAYIAARMKHEWPLVQALQRYDPEHSNCLKRIDADGRLNHGPTCMSMVPNERTPRDKWCRVCNADYILSKYTNKP